MPFTSGTFSPRVRRDRPSWAWATWSLDALGELPWERVSRDDLAGFRKLADPMLRWFLCVRDDLADVPLWKAAFADEVPTARTTVLLQGLRTSLVGSSGRRRRRSRTPPASGSAPVPAAFVRTTRNFPGLCAFVDGEETPVKAVVGFFRGMDVPAGRHELRFVFDPPALRNDIRVHASAAVVTSDSPLQMPGRRAGAD